MTVKEAQDIANKVLAGRTLDAVEVTEDYTTYYFNGARVQWSNHASSMKIQDLEQPDWELIAKRFENAALDNETAYKDLLAMYEDLVRRFREHLLRAGV